MGTTVAAAKADPRDRRRLAAVVAVLAVVAALLAPTAAGASTWGRYLVDASASLPSGARVLDHLTVADALLVSAPSAPAGAVDADVALGFQSLSDLPDADGLRLDSAVASTGASEVWATTTGDQAVVALVDTGVAPVAAMDGAMAGEIDFTGSGGGDGYGHGTFLASLIAGRGDVARGVAPGAGILSLKVGDAEGATTLGTVLSALDWLHGPGRVTGVRIAVLALGVDADSPAARLLDRAVERLARVGVLVVTAAGNDGEGALGAPATAAGSLSVGSVDDQGTADRADDVRADFSATGVDRHGVAQPDVVASGVQVVGALPADSVIARENPQAEIEPGLYRGSGTSMSTAVTAGVAALVASARPDLGGPEIDAALRAADGEVDAPAAIAAALEAPGRLHPRPDGAGGRGTGRDRLPDRVDPQAIQWRAIQWRAIQWRAIQWRAIQWRAIQWRGGSWGRRGLGPRGLGGDPVAQRRLGR